MKTKKQIQNRRQVILFSSEKAMENQNQIPSDETPEDLLMIILEMEDLVEKTNLKTASENLLSLGILKQAVELVLQLEKKIENKQPMTMTAEELKQTKDKLSEGLLTVIYKYIDEMETEIQEKAGLIADLLNLGYHETYHQLKCILQA